MAVIDLTDEDLELIRSLIRSEMERHRERPSSTRMRQLRALLEKLGASERQPAAPPEGSGKPRSGR